MLFLDFLCLCICIVLLNARPMLKSMENENSFEDKTILEAPVKLFNEKCNIKMNSLPSHLTKKKPEFKRKVTSKDMDLKIFHKFESNVDSNSPVKIYKTSVENATSILSTLSTKIYKLHELYVPIDANYVLHKNKNINKYDRNGVYTMPINDDMEFLGTAEIEEVLNDIKQREIQMIADQALTVSNLITNAVTEATFVSVPYVTQSNIFPDNTFSSFLYLGHPNKFTKQSLNNKFVRSIEEDSCTLACNIEKKLQKKLKKTFRNLKAKLYKEYDKEMEESKATIKETVEKITNITSKKICTLPYKSETKTLPKTKLIRKYTNTTRTRLDAKSTKSMGKLNNSKNVHTLPYKLETKPLLKSKLINKNLHTTTRFYTKSTKPLKKFNKGKSTTLIHKIQTLPDEFSMLSSFEKVLAESKGNHLVTNILLNTVVHENFKNKGPRKFSNQNHHNDENSYKDNEEMLDVNEYTDINDYSNSITSTDNLTEDYGQGTSDGNYEAISNKISFNDYVNGYKYYLKFQKDNDDEKYSNLVRYQAHKHHNVEDIGKYILKKIPQLPSTRLRRYFVESETLEDQDVSTKSEDSWFKRHFFVYLDTNPPRKFHTSQTVSLKPSNLQMSECTSKSSTIISKHRNITQPDRKTNILTQRRRRSKLPKIIKPLHYIQDNFENRSNREKYVYNIPLYNNKREKRSYLPIIHSSVMKKRIDSEKLSEHNICKKHIYSTKGEENFKTSIVHRNNGFVNIDLVHRSTGKVKLSKNNKRKSKIQNIFKKFHTNRRKNNNYIKSKRNNRPKRYIFRGLKHIFHEKPKNEMKNDYKIVTSKEIPKVYNNFNSLKHLNVEDIWKQIPTITGDSTHPYYYLQSDIYNHGNLYYSRKPKYELKSESIPSLSAKSFLHFNDNRGDIFGLYVKPDYTNTFDPAFSIHLNDINGPLLRNMQPNDKKSAIDSLNITTKEYNINEKPVNDQSVNGNTLLFNENYESNKTILKSTQRANLGKKPSSDDTKQLNKSVNEQWAPFNKIAKICHTVQNPFSVSMITKNRNDKPNTSFENHHGIIFHGPTITAAKNSNENAFGENAQYLLKRSQNQGMRNSKISKPVISPIARVNTPPEQYFTTFLPMQIDDFHNFLKENQIDVESVTAPLLNSLPRSLNSSNSKKINSNLKIKENVGDTKSLKPLLSNFQNRNNKLQFGEREYNMNDNNEYENSRNQKSVYDRLKRIKSITGSYMGNILTPEKGLQLTVIDLDNKVFDTNNFALGPTEKIKHQNDYITLNDKVSDKDLHLYLPMPNKNRDPLRFSHISTEEQFPEYLNHTKITTKPERVQISGHSYKYDIIYHKPPSFNYYEQHSNAKDFTSVSLKRNIKNDDIYSSSIQKPRRKVNISNHVGHRSQRGTLYGKIKASKVQSPNSENKMAYEDGDKYKTITKYSTNYENNNTKNDKTHTVSVDPKLRSPMKQKRMISNINISKYGKRNVQEEIFTAKDVAALEVVVDLMKNTVAYDGKNVDQNAFFDKCNRKSVNTVTIPPKERHVTNSIQVHIAIPYNTDKKRSLESLRLRKVFSAVLSTPVDLEYKIYSFEETTTKPTSVSHDILTPGLYLLVENTNINFPEGNFVLKPIKSTTEPSKTARHLTSITEKQITSLSSVDVEGSLLNKDFIDAVNKVIKMNEKTEFNNTNNKTKRSVSTGIRKNYDFKAEIYDLVPEIKRNINWNLLKKYFGHDRVCHCHCKANQTMCRECAACNAIITELMFELENLANYMTQHCTEIQTFFWMNPPGGRKLRDVIHRIDIILNNYYRRVKGKCQGRTCQMLSSSMDKRSINNNHLLDRFYELADDLEYALKYRIFNNDVFETSNKFITTAKNCIKTRLHKRSDGNTNIKKPIDKTIYSLRNIKVNLICNKEFTRPAFVARHTICKSSFEKDTNSQLYFDDEEIKNMKKKEKGIKAFLKKIKGKTKKLDSKNSFNRNWNTLDQIARPMMLSNLKPEPEYVQVKRYIRKSLDPSGLSKFQFNKSNKYNENTRNSSENFEIKQYTDGIKHKSNSEVIHHVLNTDSLSKNINESVKCNSNLNNNVMNKLIMNSSNKAEPETKQNSKLSSDYFFPKNTLAATTITRSYNHSRNKSTRKGISTVTKFNFLNRLKSAIHPNKGLVKSTMSTTLTTIFENRYARSRISKYRKHKSMKDKNRNVTSNENAALLIIIDDFDSKFSDELPTTRKPLNKCFNKNESLSSNLASGTKSVFHKQIIEEKKINPYNRNESAHYNNVLNKTLHCQAGNQKERPSTCNTHCNDNIFERFKNLQNNIFNYTVFTTKPKDGEGPVSKIADQFIIKVLSDRELQKGSQECQKCAYKNINRQNDDKATVDNKRDNFLTKSVMDKNKHLTSTLSVPAKTILTKIINKNKENIRKAITEKSVKNNSNIGFKEADDRNMVCDIVSTVNYVIKMHENMSKKAFELYVKQLSCVKYKNIPNYISIKYNTKNGSKKYAKYRQKYKISNTNFKNILKWEWIRDKRSLIADGIKVEPDGYEENKKFSNNEFDLAASNVPNVTNKNSRTNGSYKNVRSVKIIETTGNVKNCDKQDLKYIYDDKHTFRRIPLLTSSSIHRKRHQFDLAISTSGMKDQFYELYFKRRDNVYQQSYDRIKRSHDHIISNLRRGLQNLPHLHPLSDEIFVTMGDFVSINCDQSSNKNNQSISGYIWNTERDDMLNHENILVNGSEIFLRGVGKNNFGTYVCSKDNAVIKSIKVTITSVPSFIILFTPVYRTDSACTYKDLRAVLELNSSISQYFCEKYCSVRIDEPICLKDKINDSSYLRPIVVITLNEIPYITNCSSECKRNLQCSLTGLLVSNMPSLAFVKVIISFDDINVNNSLTPILVSKNRSLVTHTLRRKDSNGHYEYHTVAADMDPGNFNLILHCPFGFYLISEQKICVICPSNTFSEEGDNKCRICPQDTKSAPGSRLCHLSHSRLRRFVWNANEWSIATFCALALSTLSIFYGIICLFQRACRSKGNNTCNSRGNARLRKPCQKSPRRRRLSPSHVILSRLVKGSVTSSRATDSQENRFELWKEKNTLPPLPPIDFDL